MLDFMLSEKHAISILKKDHETVKDLFDRFEKAESSSEKERIITVLSESVRHHIKEEENEMLPKAKELDIDFEALGQKMLDRKKELKQDGISKDAEHSMVARAGGKEDSPAAASRKKAAAVKTVRKNGATRSAVSKGERPHASH